MQINNGRILNTLTKNKTQKRLLQVDHYPHFISVICNKRYQANICHLQGAKLSKNSINKWKKYTVY